MAQSLQVDPLTPQNLLSSSIDTTQMDRPRSLAVAQGIWYLRRTRGVNPQEIGGQVVEYRRNHHESVKAFQSMGGSRGLCM